MKKIVVVLIFVFLILTLVSPLSAQESDENSSFIIAENLILHQSRCAVLITSCCGVKTPFD